MKRRFFYHYFKAKKRMSIHWKGTCTVVDHVKTQGVDTETHRRKTQPFLVVRGFANDVRIENGVAYVS